MERSPRYLPDDWVVPGLTEENRAFFTSGELRLQKCRECSTVQHPPLDICTSCRGFEFDYVPASPYGVVESYTIVHHPVHEMLRSHVPYNVCVVALDDYPLIRVVGNVIDVEPAQLKMGLPVQASWAAANGQTEKLLIPQWRRRNGR